MASPEPRTRLPAVGGGGVGTGVDGPGGTRPAPAAPGAMRSVRLDPLYLALVTRRTQRLDDCIGVCSDMLERHATDKAAWFIKTSALAAKVYVDEAEMEEGTLFFFYFFFFLGLVCF